MSYRALEGVFLNFFFLKKQKFIKIFLENTIRYIIFIFYINCRVGSVLKVWKYRFRIVAISKISVILLNCPIRKALSCLGGVDIMYFFSISVQICLKKIISLNSFVGVGYGSVVTM